MCVKWYLIVVLMEFSLVDCEVECIFIYVLTMPAFSSVKCLLMFLLIFLFSCLVSSYRYIGDIYMC